MNILKVQFKMLFNRIEFKAIILLSLILTISSFFLKISYNFGQDITTVSIAYDMWFGISGRVFRGLFLFTLPIIGAISYSDVYYNNFKTGFNNLIITRIDKNKYIACTGVVVFLSGVIPVFLVLLIDQILCLIAFPLHNMFNPLYVLEYGVNSLFYPISMNYPYIYNFIYMIIISLFSGAFALLSYGISFIYKKSRISIVVLPFIIYIISDFISHALQIAHYSIYFNLSAGDFYDSYGINEYYYIITLFILIFSAIIMIALNMKSDEI